MPEARLLVDCRNQLGEGIQWNPRDNRVYWTDIYGNSLQSCDEDGGDYQVVPLEAGLCSFAFTENAKVLAAFADGLCWLDPTTGKRQMFAAYQPDRPRTRMNDGTLDRQGRFIVGGIDEEAQAKITPVWQVIGDEHTELFDGVGIANSLAFSPDGTQMYFADSTGTVIEVFDYDPATGRISNRRPFADTGPGHGVPDGSTVDAEGGLWNARYGGAAVLRFTSGGEIDQQVSVPALNPACCTIGGAEMNRMFITTARGGMSDEELTAYPQSGALFIVDISQRGIEAPLYSM